MDRPAHRLARTCALLLCLLPLPALAASAADAFDLGLDAFRAGDYGAARDHFEAARDAGMAKPSLTYNLGVTYYRLGAYGKARAAFRRLLADPATAPLAHYNLGLVARKLGEPATAADHFRTAYETAEKDKIRRLAGDALDRTPEPTPDRFAGIASLAVGYDDNVTLAPDELVSATDTDDTFLEALAGGSFQLAGDRGDGLQLKGSVLHLDYADIDAFDQTFLRFGPEWDFTAGAWAMDLAAYGDWIYLDGELFEAIATGEVDGRRAIGGGHALRLRYRFSRVDGRPPYGYLSGLRHRGDAAWRYADGTNRLRAGYQLEYNERDDLAVNGTYTSVSPTRHKLHLRGRREFGGAWEAEVRGSYRLSRYHDATVDTTGTATTREDTRLRAQAAVSRELPWRLRAFAEYQYTRNDSHLDSYDYTANVYTIGLERFF